MKKKLEMVSKRKQKLEDDLSQRKFATLYDPKELTLSKNVKETIAKVILKDTVTITKSLLLRT